MSVKKPALGRTVRPLRSALGCAVRRSSGDRGFQTAATPSLSKRSETPGYDTGSYKGASQSQEPSPHTAVFTRASVSGAMPRNDAIWEAGT